MATIRGAITVSENTKEDILVNTRELLEGILEKNKIQKEEIQSILFTATQDLTKVYPAVAARELGIVDTSLLCLQEMYVEGSLEKCIRVLVDIQTDKKQQDMKHIYLKGAKVLRPDLLFKFKSIAIDGPSGSGKSTVAKVLAKKLNYLYIDTGAMYRTVALYCLQNSIDTEDVEAVENALANIRIDIQHKDDAQRTFLDKQDVTERIRTQEIGMGASNVAKIEKVRQALVALQKELAKSKNIIMDGRDIGAKVLPNASLKIFLDANVETRTIRRMNELIQLGKNPSYEKIKEEVQNRDFQDTERAASPLRKADDAIVIDASDKSIEEVCSIIEALM